MRSFLLLVALLLWTINTSAQNIWDFPDPIVDQGAFSITDTVYMSVSGNDQHDGSLQQPVATFQRALDLLPFGVSGVNGGNAYGLVMLLPGEYILENGLIQSKSSFHQNGTFKNVSIEGVGEVILRGRQDSFVNTHMVHLRGSHLLVKNVNIRYARLHGLLFQKTDFGGQTDLLVENVRVDSVMGFSMLFGNVERAEVSHCQSLRASRPGSDEFESPCTWPSGIKFYDSRYVQCHDTEIAYTRGEGLNFHNSSYGLAYDNRLHDNPTNLYCDNSEKIVFRNNVSYSSPGAKVYWRTCPGDTVLINGSAGVLIGNEGACHDGTTPTYSFCKTVCIGGSTHPHCDSIFIFNNAFINTLPAIDLWQGTTSIIGGPNCIKNVFFTHNSVSGIVGDNTLERVGVIKGFFPNAHNTVFNYGFAIVENFRIEDNLVIIPAEDYPNVTFASINRHALFPVPFEMHVNNNLVNIADPYLDADNTIRPNLPMAISIHPDSLHYYLQPCDTLHHELRLSAQPHTWIVDDADYVLRNSSNNNVGAWVYSEDCFVLDVDALSLRNEPPVIYPNPGNGHIFWKVPPTLDINCTVSVFDLTGRLLQQQLHQGFPKVTNLSDLNNGIYFIQLKSEHHTFTLPYVLSR